MLFNVTHIHLISYLPCEDHDFSLRECSPLASFIDTRIAKRRVSNPFMDIVLELMAHVESLAKKTYNIGKRLLLGLLYTIL